MIDKVSMCFSSAEEGTYFVNQLINLSKELCHGAVILDYLDDESAYELMIANVYDFAKFFRENVEIVHSLIHCVEIKEKI